MEIKAYCAQNKGAKSGQSAMTTSTTIQSFECPGYENVK